MATTDRVESVEPVEQSFAPVPVPGLIGPIRRKVGFELELKLDLLKGRLVTTTEQPKKKKKAKPKEQFVGWGSKPSLGEKTSLLVEDPVDDLTPRVTERLEPDKRQDITKGETILPGSGWRLTPDGAEGDWYPEFITDAVDETKEPNRPAAIMTRIADYVTGEWGDIVAGTYRSLPRGFVVGLPSRAYRGVDLGANIHFTVGVRPDRILQLMALLAKARNGPVSEKDLVQLDMEYGKSEIEDEGLLSIDESTRSIMAKAVKEATTSGGDAVYRGLVALMGTYIAGELRILTNLHDVHHSLGENLRYCMDTGNLREFLLTGKITDQESLQFIGKKYRSWEDFVEELTSSLDGSGPSTAKLQVPVLSRSSLAELRGKTAIDHFPTFLTDVAAAAGLTVEQSAFRLFPLGISNPKRKRTIEADPTITIKRWVRTVFDGQNLTFTDEVKSFEKVGPAVPGCLCFCETREKGAVLEIRALDGDRRVQPKFWPDLADEVVSMMTQLNDT